MPHLTEQTCKALAIHILTHPNGNINSIGYVQDLFVGLRQAEHHLGHSLVAELANNGNLINALKAADIRYAAAFTYFVAFAENRPNPLPNAAIPQRFGPGFWQDVEAQVGEDNP